MSSRWFSNLTHSIGFRLTFWYALVFILCRLVLLYTGFTLVRTSIQSKDQQIVTERLDKYLAIGDNRGTDDLVKALQLEQQGDISDDFLVIVKDPDQAILYLSLPYEWRDVDPLSFMDRLAFSQNEWITVSTDKYLPADGDHPRNDELEILGRTLRNGAQIQVGYSTESREEFLEAILNRSLYAMGPVILISIAIGAFLARRFLRPVKDLSKAVERVQSGRIDTRVAIHGTDNELKVLAGQFNTMLNRIECLITGMREALDNVAHDLRTPLMRMRAAIENNVVSDQPQKWREALLDCAEESERISTMLTAIMDISEAETGVMRLSYTEFRVEDLIQETKEIFLYSAEEKNITIKADIPSGLILFADYSRLRQVLCNLVDNAVKYTPEGGNITLKAEKKETTLTLFISDTGIGIPPQDTSRIFIRLYRGDKSRSQKGLGLGLSLVKAVVHAHHGRIHVESQPNEGTTFTLSIPTSTTHRNPDLTGK